MIITKIQKMRFLFFLLFFGLTGTYFISSSGIKIGLHLTILVWSFFVLCFPFPGGALITSSVLDLFTKQSIHYARFITWSTALIVNVITYFVAPYLYLNSITTFLLYRILSNPWPYWLIIFTSALSSIYSALLINPNKKYLFRYALVKTGLMIGGILIFFYLSYIELIVFLFAKTC